MRRELTNMNTNDTTTTTALTIVQPPHVNRDAAMIHKLTERALMRIAVQRQPKAPIEVRLADAQRFSTPPPKHTVVRRIGDSLMGLYGLAVLTVRDYFDFSNRRWTT